MAPSISGLRGSVVTRPVHVPDSLFNASNEIRASDVVEGLASCPSEGCATARPHSDRMLRQSAHASDFTRRLLVKLAILLSPSSAFRHFVVPSSPRRNRR